MTVTVKFEGGKELERELQRLASPTARKASGRRALKKAAQPLADLMRSLAPDDPATSGDDLRASIAVSTKLSPRQRKSHRRMFRNDKASVEMFVGAGPLPQAHLQEFGTVHHAPQPFARPAWDRDRQAMLRRLSDELWKDIKKAVARAERKAARG